MGKRNKNDKQTRQTRKKKFQPIIWLWPNPYPVIRNPLIPYPVFWYHIPSHQNFLSTRLVPEVQWVPKRSNLKKSILKGNTTESEITTFLVPKVVHRGESRNLRWVERVRWYYPTNLYPFLCSLAVAHARTRTHTHAHARTRAITHAHTY